MVRRERIVGRQGVGGMLWMFRVPVSRHEAHLQPLTAVVCGSRGFLGTVHCLPRGDFVSARAVAPSGNPGCRALAMKCVD